MPGFEEGGVKLTGEELERYQRQILFTPFGRRGQARLKDAHVLVAGVGGLGSPVAMYLCVSGVGTLSIVDADTVALSNLNRQLLHWESDIGVRKVDSAKEKLVGMNPRVNVVAFGKRITPETVGSMLVGVDVVVDCLDNMASRYVLNRACVAAGIPFIHGGVYGMMGQLTTILPGTTPCLECIFPRKEEASQGPIPVFGPTAGMIASLQALEAIKLLSETGTLLAGRLLYLNGQVMECIVVDVQAKEDCPVCGTDSKKTRKREIVPG